MGTNQSKRASETKELNKIVDINKDAIEFYNSAQSQVQDAKLKETFSQMSELHKQTMNRVNGLLQSEDASRNRNAPSETLVGASSRVFGELLAKISSNPDGTLVKRLEEAEDRCLESIQSAVDNQDISASTRRVLNQELTNIQKTHDHMKSLKERFAA
jgi:uncharacterized protein (TIGR02284 family)